MLIIAQTNRIIISQITLRDARFFLDLVNSLNRLKYIFYEKKVNPFEDGKELLLFAGSL